MPTRSYNVLFLCTGNTARSQMAEALLNHYGNGRFKAYSAGSKPADAIHPKTLRVIKMHGIQTDGLYPKTQEEFDGKRFPAMDIAITLCDQTDGDSCPIWENIPIKANWHIPDPIVTDNPEDPEDLAPFVEAYARLEMRVRSLAALPLAGMSDETKSRTIESIAV